MSEFLQVGEILKTRPAKYMLDNHMLQKLRQKDFTGLIKTPVRIVGGKRFTLCPFHTEKTSSFCIYEDNSYYCFGCGIHGNNAIDFMVAQGNSFVDACRALETI